MTETDSWIIRLQSKMGNEFSWPTFHALRVFLFGSGKFSRPASDIDLLLVYDSTKIDWKEASDARVQLSSFLGKHFDIEADICLLTDDELSQSKFDIREKAIQLI